jgi:hypothetical protein
MSLKRSPAPIPLTPPPVVAPKAPEPFLPRLPDDLVPKGDVKYEIMYDELFKYLQNGGTDVLADKLMQDLKEVGEHAGFIDFADGRTTVRSAHISGVFDKYKAAVARLRRGRENTADVKTIKNFFRSHRYNDPGFVERAVLNRLNKSKSIQEKRHLASIVEMMIDCTGRTRGRGDIWYHFHPIPGRLSLTDLQSAKKDNLIPVAFSYDAGKMIAFYYKPSDPYLAGEDKKKEFEIKDPDKAFQLDLLMAETSAKHGFDIFYKGRSGRKICSGPFKQLIPSFRRAVFYGKQDDEKKKQILKTYRVVQGVLRQKFDYLMAVRAEFGIHPSYDETVKEYQNRMFSLKNMMIVSGLLDPESVPKVQPSPKQQPGIVLPAPGVNPAPDQGYAGKSRVPKPRQPENEGRWPGALPIGFSLMGLALAGAVGSYAWRTYQDRKRQR